MADFRKWILALAVLALFTGLASAQSTNPFQCNAQAAVTPQLRSEGLTELVGDILLTCTGGTPLPPGTQIPTANITVYMNGTVTSRLLGSYSTTNASEALLLVDEPGSGGTAYGNTVPQTLCNTPGQGAGINGCTQFVGTQGTAPATFGALTATNNLGVPVAGTSGTSGTAGANVFQGIVSGGSVTFFGIPVQPPVTSGAIRTYRITNIRVNANGITGGGPIPANAVAALAISGSTSIPISNSTLTVGYISQSLSASVNKAFSTSGIGSTGKAFNQCESQPGSGSTPVATATLRYSELQGSAFKIRGPVVSSTAGVGSAQNIPGQIYSDESGFVAPYVPSAAGGSGTSATAGLADWGTRLKAVFTNIPSGVSVFVSTTNIVNATNVAATSTLGSSFAALVVSETSPDSGFNPPATWNGSAQTPIAGVTTGMPLVTQVGTSSGVGYAPLTVVNGSASAVWEVANSIPNTIENLDFEVFITYSANTASNLPPAPSQMNVNMSYAPIPTQGAFTLSAGSVASSSLGIPRFADTSAAKGVLNIAICQTALLYPYVINTNGFDTGLAVANTTQDPFGTSAQSGYCSVYWYGSTAPSTNPGFLGNAGYQTTTPTSSQLIAAGTIQAWGASVVAPGFSGYVIAVCNFQYAHGFAFVSDLGARNLAMGYLADVMGTAAKTRGPDSEQYGQ